MTLSLRRLIALLSLSGLLPLASCGMFFYDENGLGGNATCTTNCIYIANSGTDDIAQFAGTNPLGVVNSVNVSFGEPPNSLAVSPNNAYLYAASASGSIISLFAILSGGSLADASTQVTATEPYALAVDSTSSYLLAAGLVTNSTCSSGFQIALYVYEIGAGGAITNPSATPAGGPCGATTETFPEAVAISPDSQYIFVAAGTSGIAGYTFISGVATPQPYLSTPGTADTSVNGVAVDSGSAYVFASASGTPDGGVAQYMIPPPGTSEPSQLPLVGAIQNAGGAFGAVTTSGSTYVYATALNTGQVYGFSYNSTGLTALSGSPYSPSSSASSTTAIAANPSAGFVFTANGFGPNLQEFSIGTGGALTATSTGTTSSGSYAPAALAITQ